MPNNADDELFGFQYGDEYLREVENERRRAEAAKLAREAAKAKREARWEWLLLPFALLLSPMGLVYAVVMALGFMQPGDGLDRWIWWLSITIVFIGFRVFM